jgi:hypothetical protein
MSDSAPATESNLHRPSNPKEPPMLRTSHPYTRRAGLDLGVGAVTRNPGQSSHDGGMSRVPN